MRHFGLKLLVLIFALPFAVLPATKPGTGIVKHLPLDGIAGVVLKNRTNSQYLPGCVIIKMMPQTTTSLSKSALGVASVDKILTRALGVSTARLYPTAASTSKPGEVDLSLLYVASYSSPNDPFTLSEELSKLPEVQYAEPWFIYPLADRAFAPNDSLYSLQWALKQVSASSAWDITQGDSTIVVGIVDSGVEWTHPDLAANIWINPGERGFDALQRDKRSNGTDDDGNAYVDDWHGWDLVGAHYGTYDPASTVGDNDPSPTASNNDHGTHVAGIIAAVTNNLSGVASLAPKCRILPVKVSADDDFRGGGSAYILAGYPGIKYAVDMGAKIINCSWGGSGGSQAEQDIIDYATQHGALVVAAAGNDNANTFFSPADYRGVLAVAATDQNDVRAYFSNYGENVDVCAPGVAIWSTLYPHTYASLSGTSMASPLAAALAALVRTRFPNYNGLQVGEQVRVTCDNIDAVNKGYAGQLGRGRINALRALTVSNLPSVRLQSYAINDFPGGNGNGVAEPAETLNVVCSFKNYLAPTSAGAVVGLTSDSPYLTIVNGAFPLAALNTLDTVSNKTAPFRVYVNPSVPPSQAVHLILTVNDGSYSDQQAVSLLLNPTFATENVNSIQLTLTNDGRLGFFDFPDNKLGKGFIFSGINHLFEGGLIIGTSSTKVVDVVRNETGVQDQDFTSRNFFSLKSPGIVSDQDGSTMFSDSGAVAANILGVQIKMQSFAYSDPTDSRYVILQYDVTNTSSVAISNLYAGLFLDWDIGDQNQTEVAQNYSLYDATRSLGYAFSGMPQGRREYLGVRALDSAASFRSLVNTPTIDLSRAAKWDWLSGGFNATIAGPADIHQVISSGPYSINPGATRRIGFALVAGDSSLSNIQQNADAAKAKWLAISKIVGIANDAPGIPSTYNLFQNYPNPFNPSTAISFQLSAVSVVSLKVYDVLGREIVTLVNGQRQPGTYTVHWDASSFPSGVYLYRLRADDVSLGSSRSFIETRKMLFMK